MLLDGRLIGVVYLDIRVAKGMFTVEDTSRADNLASRIESVVGKGLED